MCGMAVAGHELWVGVEERYAAGKIVDHRLQFRGLTLELGYVDSQTDGVAGGCTTLTELNKAVM